MTGVKRPVLELIFSLISATFLLVTSSVALSDGKSDSDETCGGIETYLESVNAGVSVSSVKMSERVEGLYEIQFERSVGQTFYGLPDSDLLVLGAMRVVESSYPFVAYEEDSDRATIDKIQRHLEGAFSNVRISSVSPSEMDTLFKIVTDDINIGYFHTTSAKWIQGDIFRLTPQGFENLSEQSRNLERLRLVQNVETEDKIIFSPEGSATKASIYAFIDVECPHCQRFHKHLKELNEAGVEVQYLAFPRAGVDSSAYVKMKNAWCSDDKHKAIDASLKKQELEEVKCAANPIEAQYELGLKVGMRGTPGLVTPEGKLISGYHTVADVLAELGL